MATTKQNERKVERAFRVIEQLEEKEKKHEPKALPPDEDTEIEKRNKKSGLQIRFSLDALISDKDSKKSKEKDLRAGESNLLNFKITVPFIWRLPVIGKTALKIINRIQTEEYPETVRDLLNSLKSKRPF